MPACGDVSLRKQGTPLAMSDAMSRAALACSLLAGALLVVCPTLINTFTTQPLKPRHARILETVTLVFDATPRLGGYTPDAAVRGAAIETITRGHVLQQLNFGNSFGTTPGMLARGGASGEMYPGFDLSRKF
jgi:uncharacterized SAM-binding protein YcdF (DUF218 family)